VDNQPVAWRVVCDGPSELDREQWGDMIDNVHAIGGLHGSVHLSQESAHGEIRRLNLMPDVPAEHREKLRCGPHRVEPLYAKEDPNG